MPAEVLRQVRALMREGKSESRAYAIAVANYKRKHGHPPRMHRKVAKAAVKIPDVRSQTDNRVKDFVIDPVRVQLEILAELRKITELLKKQEPKTL